MIMGFVLLGACKAKNNSKLDFDIESIKIDAKSISEIPEDFKESEVIKIIGESIGKIINLKVLENGNLVLRTTSGKTRVYLYDITTKKIIPVANKGKGPSELLGIDDVFIYDHKIHVLDKMRKQLHSFSNAGVFIEKADLPDYFHEIIMHKENLYGVKNIPVNFKNDYKINVLEKANENLKKPSFKFKYKQRLLSDLDEERDLPHNDPLYVYKDKLYLAQSFNDTVFNIGTEGKMIPKYSMDFSPYKFPYDLYSNKKLKLFQFVETVRKRDNYIWGMSYFLENSKYICLKYYVSPKNESHFSIYNKETKESKTFKTLNLEKQLGVVGVEVGPGFYPASIDEKYIYFVVEPYYLLELNKDKEKFNSAISDIDYGDNPMIIKFKIN